MKKHDILFAALVLTFGVPFVSLAQDDVTDSVETTVVKKKVSTSKTVSYPMKEVRGVVFDAATKTPLGGIQVQTLNNRSFTAMTNEHGQFTISVPTFATSLYLHSTRYLSQQIAIGKDGNELQVMMIADKFGKMYDNSTNVLASTSLKLNHTTSQSVETDIENKLGADIRSITRNGGPGYGSAMFIRGLNSLNANTQPLFVVDGVVRDMQPTRTSLHYGDYTNLLLNINPEDIETVTVLKNGTAIYGAKGANGVILITTKRGYSMATRIDANFGVGISMQPRLPDMMNAVQYRLYASELLGTYPDISRYINDLKFLNNDPSKYYYKTYHNDYDWSKEAYRTVLTQNYNINVQGGDDVGMYNLSLGYTDGKSTARCNGFDRLNIRFNTDINIIGNLSTRFDMAYTKINRDVFDNGAPKDFSLSPVSSPTLLGLIKAPILNPYTYNSITGTLSSTLSGADDFLTTLNPDLTLANPTALLKNGEAINKNRVETTEFYAVLAPKYQITEHWVLTETFNYTLDRISQRYYRPIGGVPSFMIKGVGRVQNLAMSMFSKETSVMSDTRLRFTKNLSEHFIDAYGGFRFTSFAYDDNEPQGQYSTAGNDKTPNISKDMDFQGATGVDDLWKSITWYANADYNYRNRYFLQGSLAMESSSRFGRNAGGLSLAGVKWGLFPSIQAAWALSNELWFPRNIGINYMLLKAGYDISGNDDINNYAARTSFGVMKYLNRSVAAQLNNIGNDEIQWEQTGKFNVGLQSYLLANRIGIDFNFFMSRTTNLLMLKTFDNPIAGINNYWSNSGILANRGFELTLTGKPIVRRHLNMELGVSLAHAQNKIKSMPVNTYYYIDGGLHLRGYTSSIYGMDNIGTFEDHPVGTFYGYRTAGVFATDAEAAAAGHGGYLYQVDETGAKQFFKAGDVHFVDINGDGVIDAADKTIIGNSNPLLYGNLFANVTWKNLTLSIGFNYVLGNDVYNYQRSILEGGNNFYNQTLAMTNRWRFEGQITSIPRAVYGDPMGNSRFSDRWIEDGSYLRLKTLNLSYKVPLSLSWLQGLTIWTEANNLFTLSRYLGSDPEFSAANSVLYQGIDTGNVGIGRAFTFGMKINL